MQLLNSLKPPPPPNARNTLNFIPYAIFHSVMVLDSGVAPPPPVEKSCLHPCSVCLCLLGLYTFEPLNQQEIAQ